MKNYWRWFVELSSAASRSYRFGLEYSRIYISGRPYLDRFIVHVVGTLRLHRFFQGDDARASHTHPWPWFITLPFADYLEVVYDKGTPTELRTVKAWRLHFRRGNFEHVVMGRADGSVRPFWTLVLTGGYSQPWGFYPKPGTFVDYKNWPGAMN